MYLNTKNYLHFKKHYIKFTYMKTKNLNTTFHQLTTVKLTQGNLIMTILISVYFVLAILPIVHSYYDSFKTLKQL